MALLTITLCDQIVIPRRLPDEVESALVVRATHRDPVYKLHMRRGLSLQGLSRYMTTYSVRDGNLCLWRGMLRDVKKILEKYKVRVQYKDERKWFKKRIDFGNRIELFDYQKDPVAVMQARRQTVGRAPAGSGKTEMLLSAVAHFGQPTLILVWQERQQKVWLDRIPKWFDIEPGGVGGVFKKEKDAPIMVGMVQSVRNRIDDMRERFGAVICDEVSRFAAPTLSDVVNRMPARIRLGASDDERRRDEREFLLYDTFGPMGWKLGKATGQCDVEVVAVPTRTRINLVGWNPSWPDIIEDLTLNSDRNNLITNLACREARDGHSVLIWSDRVAHCEELKRLLLKRKIKAGLLIGSKARKGEANKTEKGLATGKVQVGIGTVVAEQAINIPPLSRGIMTCASADTKMFRFRQMRGRLARPYEGKHSRLFYLWDQKVRFLGNKINNIRRLYPVKIYRFGEQTKEKKRMSEKAEITIETLKKGAALLKLKVPKGTSFKKLENMIKRELAKDKTYGSYACESCGRDIVDVIPLCPYCVVRFKPVGDAEDAPAPEPTEDEEIEEVEDEEEIEEVDEDELEEDADEEEDEDEGEEEDEGADYDDEEEAEEDEEEAEDEDAEEEDEEDEAEEEDEDEAEEEDEDELEDDEEEEDEEEEEEEPPPPVKKKAKKKATRAKAKTVESKEDMRRELKAGVPYSLADLKQMKRIYLISLASVLGIKHPVSLGSQDKIIKAIVRAQNKTKPATTKKKVSKKKVAKRSAAPVAKKKVSKKKVAKKKARRR